jgi:O-methyltransferase
MFNLKKVKIARKVLKLLTDLLFKLFQLILRYKETRKDYGIEIFEYFYLPWRNNKEFIKTYDLFSEHTLNPKSRMYSLYTLSKKFLIDDTSFFEVGTWKGGATGIVAMSNSEKNVNYFVCDTFTGVANVSDSDSFFTGNEYSDATLEDINVVKDILKKDLMVVEGIFPESFNNFELKRPISFAHIDVDTYISAKNSFEFIARNALKGCVVVLDDYGGWFTDGVTRYGNELIENSDYVAIPNHLGQLIIYLQ